LSHQEPRQDRTAPRGDATKANPPKGGDAKRRGYRMRIPRATPAAPPTEPE